MNEVPVSFPRKIVKNTYAGATAVRLSSPSHTELFLTSVPVGGERPEQVLARAAELVRDSGCEIVAQDVIGLRNRDGSVTRMLEKAFGDLSWPVTWIEPGDDVPQGLFGTQIWAVAGVALKRLELNGRVAGSILENDAVRYLRLGGIVPKSGAAPRGEQARDVLDQMDAHLHAAGMTFHDVARTWFYADDILAWYDDFNHARTAFFRARNVFNGLMPASTGIGAANASGTALVAGILALQAKNPETQCVAVPSPMQCSASSYGSSFSRAVELSEPGLRRLLVSGTASIDPEGRTAHVADVKAQVALTMDVVNAILQSRDMGWQDVSRAVAYFKCSRDLPPFVVYCEENGLSALPVVSMCADVCREDLLFEIEVDALKAG